MSVSPMAASASLFVPTTSATAPSDVPRPVLSIERPVLTPDEEQTQWLAVSLRLVDEQASHMRAHMQAGDVRAAMRAAATLFGELAVDTLAPHRYYELYMHIFDAAQELRTFIAHVCGHADTDNNDGSSSNHRQASNEDDGASSYALLETLYEEAQYLPAIVPRLYLVVVVGGAYMTVVQRRVEASSATRSSTTRLRELLRDMVDLCKGVQHPTRGLFLRHFLLSMTKGCLPGDGVNNNDNNSDTTDKTTTRRSSSSDSKNNDNDETAAALHETISLLLHNLSEMTWLWIRMEAARPSPPPQQQTTTATAAAQPSLVVMPAQLARRIRQERSELRVLVGMNVVRVASLDGVDVALYRDLVLPRLLSVVVKYREAMAQQYLFEVLVHVFPAEYHAQTLRPLLAALFCLAPDVDVCDTMRVLLERLAGYVATLRTADKEGSNNNNKSNSNNNDEADAVVRDVFEACVAALRETTVLYDARPRIDRMVKRTSSTPPRTPLGFAAYLDMVNSLVKFVGATAAPATSQGDADATRARIEVLLQCVVERYSSASTAATTTRARHDGKTPAASTTTTTTSSSTAAPAVIVPSRTALRTTVKLLLSVLAHTSSVYAALDLDSFRALAARLPYVPRRTLALAVCEAALHDAARAQTHERQQQQQQQQQQPSSHGRGVVSVRDATHLFALLEPLLHDAADAPRDTDDSAAATTATASEFAQEQQTLCRVLHLLHDGSHTSTSERGRRRDADVLTYVAVLQHARTALAGGSARHRACVYPTLVSLYTRAALELRDAQATASTTTTTTTTHDAQQEEQEGSAQTALTTALDEVFAALYSGDGGGGVLEQLSRECATRAYHIYLDVAATADACGRGEDCYNLYTEAFSLYEQYAADTRTQLAMLTTAMGSLCALAGGSVTRDAYTVLASKTAQYSATLMHRHDRCVMLAQCAWVWLHAADMYTQAAATATSVDDDNNDNDNSSSSSDDLVRRARAVLLRALQMRTQVLPAHRLGALVRLVTVVVALLDAHADMLLRLPSQQQQQHEHDDDVGDDGGMRDSTRAGDEDEVAAAVAALLHELHEASGTAHADDDGDKKSKNSSSGSSGGEVEGMSNSRSSTQAARVLYKKTMAHIRMRAAHEPRLRALVVV